MKGTLYRLFQNFVQSGSVGGIILILCVFVSLFIANSSSGTPFEQLLSTEIGYASENLHLRYSVLIWINDGLMAIFFLMVGLEIKRELIEGELSSLKKAALPIFAALGGVLVPASIYYAFNQGTETAGGWGIPMATDIAFALAVVTLLGKRVPASLKIFLAALAIVDDLAAIVVIAVFYSTDLHVTYLAYAAAIFAGLLLMNWRGVTHPVFYLIPGLFIWYFIHHSGIHATIAGVLTAFTLPTTEDDTPSTLEKVEHALIKPVNFIIMPLFALVNTNIRFESGMLEGLTTTLGLGILLGLVVGKPLGISLFSWLSVKAGWCVLPAGARWRHLIGLGILGGIGFTMSIFIALLSFPAQPEVAAKAKFAILTASTLAGVLGYMLLNTISKRQALEVNGE
ncbi:NhaA family Na+:H+ antiporter [Larkinella arboricola]|uniref:Na(+)/H(+) antiporter NhaA n=1 Tax=Larkinella arboricola TaxID=643671 RepID=A0A327X904_LARAB|nr:Na+/H+ antiporter NhaA [Larkinella arboricola]RAK02738.1 NhaA family Na+:H+ antiporter [Larkinella arboricola]